MKKLGLLLILVLVSLGISISFIYLMGTIFGFGSSGGFISGPTAESITYFICAFVIYTALVTIGSFKMVKLNIKQFALVVILHFIIPFIFIQVSTYMDNIQVQKENEALQSNRLEKQNEILEKVKEYKIIQEYDQSINNVGIYYESETNPIIHYITEDNGYLVELFNINSNTSTYVDSYYVDKETDLKITRENSNLLFKFIGKDASTNMITSKIYIKSNQNSGYTEKQISYISEAFWNSLNNYR